jgi:hypothetical protein
MAQDLDERRPDEGEDVVKPLPRSEEAIVLRTDFADDAAWDAVCTTIRTPVRVFGFPIGFNANVSFVDDVAYRDLSTAQILALFGPDANHAFVIVVDRTAIADPDHAVLVIDLLEPPGRTFRAVPSTVQSIENNLSIANMDFEEFADAADADGVFRGFPRP